MQLKKRETIENVNFNKKGEKIENSFFDENEKKEENESAENTKPVEKIEVKAQTLDKKNESERPVLAKPDENLQKGVSVSSKPDSTIAIANGSPVEDNKRNKKNKILKSVLMFSAIFSSILLLAGVYFAIEAKDVYLTNIPLEKIIKGDAQAVFSINSNVDFEQYKYLDDNLRKFPGYKLIEKELDDAGEGKSISEAFQEELAAKNLSFNDDIKPVIGDETLVVIPRLTPLTNEFKKMVFEGSKKAKNALRKMELEGKVADAGKALMDGDIANAGKIKVLGVTSDFYADGIGIDERKSEPVDLIIGANIKSLKDAKRVLEKLKSDRNKYEVSEIKFEGYTYYKITQKSQEQEEYSQLLTSIKDTYHALIGQNWIMATNENDLKEMISARKADHVMSKIAFWKKNKGSMTKLSDDRSYEFISENLSVQNQDGFASFYLKANLNDLDPSEYSGGQSKKIFKLQENDLVMGFLVRATPEGIVLRTSSNQIDFSGVENTPVEAGLIEQMPTKADGRWSDLYSETSSLKNFYYNIKKNNFTDEGLKLFNEARGEIRQQLGFDPETDLIDHFNGNVAVAAFTSAGMSPQGAVIVEIDNEEALLESMRKIVEMIREVEMMPYQYAINLNAVGNNNTQIDAEGAQNDLQMNYRLHDSGRQKEIEEKIRLIKESQFSQVETDAGSVYTYQIPSIDEISFNVAFSENKMIWGTSQNVVVDLIEGFRDANAPKLVDSDNFQNVVRNIYPQGYSKAFITPMGVWNGINYYVGKMEDSHIIRRGEDREMISAIGTIFRTINSVSVIQASSPFTDTKSINKSAIFIEVKEVEAAEKENAERIFEKYQTF